MKLNSKLADKADSYLLFIAVASVILSIIVINLNITGEAQDVDFTLNNSNPPPPTSNY